MSHKLPSETAIFVDAPQAVPIVQATLRGIGRVFEWKDKKKKKEYEDYFKGCQYEDRPYNWDGSFATGSEVLGLPAYPHDHVPSFSHRKPQANYPISRSIVERLTAVVFGEERKPHIECHEDKDSEEFAESVIKAATLNEVFKSARNMGGATGHVCLSWGWRDGKPIVDVHSDRLCVILDYSDFDSKKVRHALKFWTSEAPSVNELGQIENKKTWFAKEWLGPKTDAQGNTIERGAERIYKYNPGNKASPLLDPPRWETVAEVEALSCNFIRVANANTPDLLEGRSDVEGCLHLIDEFILVMNATTNGTVNNAEPTLCINAPPSMNDGAPVKKGGYNTIFGQASYLEMSGSHVSAGITNGDRLKALLHEFTHVAMLDPEKLTGVQSGEAMRRLLFATSQWCSTLRTSYGEAYLTVLRGLVEIAQTMVAGQVVELPAVDKQGQPIMLNGESLRYRKAGIRFNIPRIKVKEKVMEEEVLVEKVVFTKEPVPGTSLEFELEWPKMFDDTSVDRDNELKFWGTANGNKPLISHITSIDKAKNLTGAKSGAAEMKAMLDEAEAEMAIAVKQAEMQAEATAKVQSKYNQQEQPPAEPGVTP